MGNTCFLNSTLQCLLHTTPLKNYLMSQIHSAKCKVNGNCPFCALERLMIQANTTSSHYLTPKEIVNNLRKSWKQYRFGRQEDAHEFLIMLMDGILKASFGNLAKLSKKYEHLTMIYRIFAGKLRSQVMCLSCNYCSNAYDPFLTLSLDVSKGNTFEDCIKSFCAPEILDGSNKYRCGGCNKLSKARKRMTIFKPPRILTIQFMRFTATGRKIGKHIQFPKSFNLRVFVSDNIDSKTPRDQQADYIYDLYGVIVHSGTTCKSGHYYSFVKSDEKWFICNDEMVSEVTNINKVLSQNAYILFYKYRIPEEQKPSTRILRKEHISPSLSLENTKSSSTELKESSEANIIKDPKQLISFFESERNGDSNTNKVNSNNKVKSIDDKNKSSKIVQSTSAHKLNGEINNRKEKLYISEASLQTSNPQVSSVPISANDQSSIPLATKNQSLVSDKTISKKRDLKSESKNIEEAPPTQSNESCTLSAKDSEELKLLLKKQKKNWLRHLRRQRQRLAKAGNP